MRKPGWLNKKIDFSRLRFVEKTLKDLNLYTVCQEARCPNISECFHKNIATFLILGNICTRDCSFCGVRKGRPLSPDIDEPERVARAVRRLNLRFVVITSVCRDDLQDQGVSFFIDTIKKIRKLNSGVDIETLIPDFSGDTNLIRALTKSKPKIINHNLETIKRLYPLLRKKSNYHRSLDVLHFIKTASPEVYTKSGIMLGFGEREDEVVRLLQDLRKVKCDFLSMGQYLAPTKGHFPVKKYIEKEQFEKYQKIALKLGFRHVISFPYARSSFAASSYTTSKSIID
ncbi:MAG: lipoyl synthase [Candidatus Omnitrophica bacterium]|nr:lipoyl synthase [Candidatus Omnitrophota bacterium]